MDFGEIMTFAAAALKKRVSDLVVVMLDRPRNQKYLETVRQQEAALRLISDGDIAAAVAPSLAGLRRRPLRRHRWRTGRHPHRCRTESPRRGNSIFACGRATKRSATELLSSGVKEADLPAHLFHR